MARNDIRSLLQQLRRYPDITEANGADIDALLREMPPPAELTGVVVTATRLPPVDFWRTPPPPERPTTTIPRTRDDGERPGPDGSDAPERPTPGHNNDAPTAPTQPSPQQPPGPHGAAVPPWIRQKRTFGARPEETGQAWGADGASTPIVENVCGGTADVGGGAAGAGHRSGTRTVNAVPWWVAHRPAAAATAPSTGFPPGAPTGEDGQATERDWWMGRTSTAPRLNPSLSPNPHPAGPHPSTRW